MKITFSFYSVLALDQEGIINRVAIRSKHIVSRVSFMVPTKIIPFIFIGGYAYTIDFLFLPIVLCFVYKVFAPHEMIVVNMFRFYSS